MQKECIEYGVSIVIPVYNEAGGIREFIHHLHRALESFPYPVEMIAVDDGSSDETAALLSQEPLKLVRHAINRGYGAAIKTGIEVCSYEAIVIIDADGTYDPHDIQKIVAHLDANDMVVGARNGQDAQIPLSRKPAKWIIRKFAEWMVRRPIPDLNSGLRAFRKSYIEKVHRLLPDGFSLTTTLTVALMTSGRRVHYETVHYHKRAGKSKFKPIADTWNMILLILRTVVLIRPLNVFLPLSFILAVAAIGIGVWSKLCTEQFMDATFIVLMTTSIQMFVLGLIADLVVRITLWTH